MVGEARDGALTDPAVHDVGLNDGTLPAKVLCHGGAAHLQVLHLQGGPACSHTTRGPARHPPPFSHTHNAPASSPRVCQVGTGGQAAPSPPASISPAVSLPDAERARPLPHLTALLAAEAGPEGCWIRTTGREGERPAPAQ